MDAESRDLFKGFLHHQALNACRPHSVPLALEGPLVGVSERNLQHKYINRRISNHQHQHELEIHQQPFLASRKRGVHTADPSMNNGTRGKAWSNNAASRPSSTTLTPSKRLSELARPHTCPDYLVDNNESHAQVIDAEELASIPVVKDLPERDRVALKLGRLIMMCMTEKKEGIRPTSRFFLDKWLHQYRSNSELAGPLNIELLARLQHARTLTQHDEGDNSSLEKRSKLLMAVACEAFDTVCEHLGSSQPALLEIRSVFYSSIFVDKIHPCRMGKKVSNDSPLEEGPAATTTADALSGLSDYAERKVWFENDRTQEIESLKAQLKDMRLSQASIERQTRLYQKEVSHRERQVNKLSLQVEAARLNSQSLEKQLSQETAQKDYFRSKPQKAESVLIESQDHRKTSQSDIQAIKAEAQNQVLEMENRLEEVMEVMKALEQEKDRAVEEANRLKAYYTDIIHRKEKERDQALLAKAQSERGRELEMNRARQAHLRISDAQTKFKSLLKAVKNVVKTQNVMAARGKGNLSATTDGIGKVVGTVAEEAVDQLEEEGGGRSLVVEEEEQYEERHQKQMLEELQQLQALLPYAHDAKQREETLIQAHSSKLAQMRHDYDLRISDLHPHLEDLEALLARTTAEANSNQTTLSRQLFVTQTELNAAMQTIVRMTQKLNQIEEWKKKDAESQAIITTLKTQLEEKGTHDMELLGQTHRIKRAETEIAETKRRLTLKEEEMHTVQADLSTEKKRRSSLWQQLAETLNNPVMSLTGTMSSATNGGGTPSQQQQGIQDEVRDKRRHTQADSQELQNLRAREPGILASIQELEETLRLRNEEIVALKLEVNRLRELMTSQTDARRRSIRHALSSPATICAAAGIDEYKARKGSTVSNQVPPCNDLLQVSVAAKKEQQEPQAEEGQEVEEPPSQPNGPAAVDIQAIENDETSVSSELTLQIVETPNPVPSFPPSQEDEEYENTDEEADGDSAFVQGLQKEVKQLREMLEGLQSQLANKEQEIENLRQALAEAMSRNRDIAEEGEPKRGKGHRSSDSNHRRVPTEYNGDSMKLKDALQQDYNVEGEMAFSANKEEENAGGLSQRQAAVTVTDSATLLPQQNKHKREEQQNHPAGINPEAGGTEGAAEQDLSLASAASVNECSSNEVAESPETEKDVACQTQSLGLFYGSAQLEGFVQIVNEVMTEIRKSCQPQVDPMHLDDQCQEKEKDQEEEDEEEGGTNSDAIAKRCRLSSRGYTLSNKSTNISRRRPQSAIVPSTSPAPDLVLRPASSLLSRQQQQRQLFSSGGGHTLIVTDDDNENNEESTKDRSVSPSSSPPNNMEEKLKELHSLLPLLRNRILFGATWSNYTEELADIEKKDLAEVTLLARTMNRKLLRHQGNVSKLDAYLGTLLQRQRDKASDQAEKYHLEQILFRKNVPSTVLMWATKRAELLNAPGLQSLRPPSRDYHHHLARQSQEIDEHGLGNQPIYNSDRIKRALLTRYSRVGR